MDLVRVQLLVVLCLYGIGSSFALHMEISSDQKYWLDSNHVNITCLFQGDAPKKGLISLEVGHNGRDYDAIMYGGKEPSLRDFGKNRRHGMQVEGQMDEDNPSKSYLKMTINDPEMEDAGNYYCQMYYMDYFFDFVYGYAYGKMAVVSPECPDGWRYYEDDKTCLQLQGYSIFGKNDINGLGWNEARKVCQGQGQGGDLAVIKDQKKNTFVYDLSYEATKFPWIGIRNEATSGFDFKYVDGSPIGRHHPWMQGSPNGKDNTDEKCVHMTLFPVAPFGMWQDFNCSSLQSYVCQTPSLE